MLALAQTELCKRVYLEVKNDFCLCRMTVNGVCLWSRDYPNLVFIPRFSVNFL